MTTQHNLNYDRIASAIDYIIEHFKEQPELEDIAKQVHLSPFHFQKMFTDWAGVSPKKFLQYLSIEHAKKVLKTSETSLFDTAFESGLSGTGRLHDLFVSIEGMTPGEFKNGGAQLSINHSFVQSPFGDLIIGSTEKGICFMAFAENEKAGLEALRSCYPNATLRQRTDILQQQALYIFSKEWDKPEQVKLHIKGSPFQLKVWETLLSIPAGDLSTYSSIAKKIQHPKASRAVGSAIANNPVALLIPCHRVIQASGKLGNYHWGTTRKAAIIGWEAASNRN